MNKVPPALGPTVYSDGCRAESAKGVNMAGIAVDCSYGSIAAAPYPPLLAASLSVKIEPYHKLPYGLI